MIDMNPQSIDLPLNWDDSQVYLPLPRHRRKIILHFLKGLDFSSCLDVGCGQHHLLRDITRQYAVKGYGCDISDKIIAVNAKRLTHCEFITLDLEKDAWPNEKQFDLVICSEVLEHILHWENAVKNLAAMAKRYLLVSVPSGRLRTSDKLVGHYRLYSGAELAAAIENQGFKCVRVLKHGFPMHSFYKWLINLLPTDKLYNSFHSGKKYSGLKKLFAHGLYFAFYINYLFSSGSQLYILAERNLNHENT